MKPKILLIGWREQSAAALLRLGVEVICVHGMKDAAAVREFGRIETTAAVEDVQDVEQTLFAATRLTLGGAPPMNVCSGSEFTMVPAAVIGTAFGKSTVAIPTAVRLRDKFTQKALVRSAGVPTADTWIVSSADDARGVSFPAVVKPLAGGGAVSTFIVKSPEQLGPHLASGAPMLVESFVAGRELQIDGVVRNGVVTFFTASRYLSNLIAVHDGELTGAIVMPPSEAPGLYDKAQALCDIVMNALGHTDGVFHMEAFETAEGLVFSECAGRISGGSADAAIRLSTGCDLHDEWARAVTGLPSAAKSDWVGQAFGDVQVPAPPGRIIRMPSEPEIVSRRGVHSVLSHVGPGDMMRDATQSSDIRAITAVVKGATTGVVEDNMLQLAKWFADEVETA